ncbi:MAG: 3-oxoacyl-(acyl-carrier-protein) reductase FabG [Verrucomicrobia bacterium ADurb.Bin345]|nr:MAG: 3-oxoacyl-(acyl-carrier-protein) reductase FabG [Verrucomicrobia bacterium ADurb.Bin345]
MNIRLDGKTALVTGGSSGIGEACVRLLCESGANVFFTYNKGGKNAAKIASITSAKAIQCDGAREQACRDTVEQIILAAGRMDILVNNAGIYESAAADAPAFPAVWKNVMAVNLDACAYFIHFAVPHLKKRGGKIVNISSIHAADGTTHAAAYHASKAGMDGLTRAMAVELAPHNIQVNSIGPGATATPMWGDPGDDYAAEIAKLVPARRFGKPEEIAAAVVFLTSPLADYITGQTLFVDGGILINSYKE